MMNFRTIKTSIIDNVLGPAEAGRFQAIGFQRQAKSSAEVKGLLRTVQLYYSSGDFPKSAGRTSGTTQHNVMYRVDLTVAEPAKGDVAALNNPASTPAEKAAALLAFQEGSNLADDSLDELYDIVYQILMDARNIDMGLGKGVVSSRWVGSIQKDQPIPNGELVTLTGSMQLTLKTPEIITGDTGTAAGIFDTVIDIDGDDVEKTGVLVDNT
jgi:hypothetical protein